MSRVLQSLWYGRPGPAARLLGAVISPAALAFRAGVALRNTSYERGWRRVERVPDARVISVGNLVVGGAGKTPAVIDLAERLQRAGRKVAVLSRGYGRRSRGDVVLAPGEKTRSWEECGDEPLVIASRLPGIPVLVGPDRVRLARRAVRELGADTLVLDDGFQHRRLARQLDVVVVDEAVGFGNGRILPRGPLREPLSALQRAGLVWIRAGTGTAFPLPAIAAPVVRARYKPQELQMPEGAVRPPQALAGRRVLAVSGIGRPAGFEATLRELGAVLVAHHTRPDHAAFETGWLDRLQRKAEQEDCLLVTTEKDRVRLPPGWPAWTVRLEVELLEGAEALDRALLLESDAAQLLPGNPR